MKETFSNKKLSKWEENHTTKTSIENQRDVCGRNVHLLHQKELSCETIQKIYVFNLLFIHFSFFFFINFMLKRFKYLYL